MEGSFSSSLFKRRPVLCSLCRSVPGPASAPVVLGAASGSHDWPCRDRRFGYNLLVHRYPTPCRMIKKRVTLTLRSARIWGGVMHRATAARFARLGA